MKRKSYKSHKKRLRGHFRNLLKNFRGLAPIKIIIIFLVVGAVGFFILTKAGIVNPSFKAEGDTQQGLLQDIINNSQDKAQPVATAKTTPTGTPIPTPATSATCTVNFFTSGSPQTVYLVYGAQNFKGEEHVSGVQWDFTGDGTWDTDMSLNNNNIPHTYTNGTHNVKLQLKLSDGNTTPVCSKKLTVPFGFTVSLIGFVFEDINCNEVRDVGEKGLSGARVHIVNLQDYSEQATLTTDANGFYRFTKNLTPGGSIRLTPEDDPLDNYGSNNRGEVSLNESTRDAAMDLGQVPAPVADYCSPVNP